MQILRNVFRRKLRVFLTIFGITIGVLALVVMGSMAEKINLLVAGGTRYYSDKVTVSAAGMSSMFSSSLLSVGKRDEIKAVPGVAEVSAQIGTLLDPDGGASFGMPPMLMGGDMRGEDLESFKISYAQGRKLTPQDTGSVVVGADLVKRLSAKVGGSVTIRGEQYKVVGIADKTLTAPDSSVWMTLPDAQKIFMQDVPEMVRNQIDQSAVATSFVVYPTAGTDPETLAADINAAVSGVKATGPSAFQKEIANTTQIFNLILYGIAIISLVVGGLSVINTMTISVSERTREIGVRKAIGASDGQIVRQFLAEASMIGLIGGVSGLAIGWIAVTLVNKALESTNINLFLVTPRLAIGSVVFAVVLGLVSGLYPSLHAARMQPVAALRYE
ncbi:MAG: ABC transporter permease [Actinobacteria bacterium]|nr:ABC transporter permease [Actinomycetota bacterium]